MRAQLAAEADQGAAVAGPFLIVDGKRARKIAGMGLDGPGEANSRRRSP